MSKRTTTATTKPAKPTTTTTTSLYGIRPTRGNVTPIIWATLDEAKTEPTTKDLELLALAFGWNIRTLRSHFFQWRAARRGGAK